jgi:hypothetical protein
MQRYKIHAHLKDEKRGGRSCFTSVSHRNTALPTWKSSGSRRRSCLLAEFFDGTLCTEITHPSRTPHEPEATKVTFHESSNGSQPPWQAPPAPACGTDLTQVTTPSHRVVKFISSFKQKQSFLAWHTPRHSWHGNEPDLLIDELRVPTGPPVQRYCHERSYNHALRNASDILHEHKHTGKLCTGVISCPIASAKSSCKWHFCN